MRFLTILGFYLAVPQLVLAERPNIVFIMSDDHAYQAVSAYGHRLNSTPNIDRIAKEGIQFDRCYVTNSICGPSRATLLTGKYSHKNGVPDNYTEFDGSQTTLPKLLQSAGYQTAIVGKWHLKSDPTGFDYWDVLPGQGKYYRPDFRSPAGRRAEEGYTTNIITRLATTWLEQDRQAERPFFLMIHHKAPHRPWYPAPDQLTAFGDTEFPEPRTLFDNYQGRSSAVHEAEMRIEQMNPSTDLKIWHENNRHRKWLYSHMSDDVRRMWEATYDPRFDEFGSDNRTEHQRRRWMYQLYLRDYLRCINSVDDSVGQILECLKRNQLEQNTIVVYTSDQGFYLGEHGWFDKRLMYEPSLRTPLVVRWPGVTAPGRTESEAIVSNVDLAPTLLDAADCNVPTEMQGQSFRTLLAGEPLNDWREVFYYQYIEGRERDHHVARHDGVTDGRFKLIHYYESDEWELYDLATDPHEVHNRYDDESISQEVMRMKGHLDRLRRELEVPKHMANS